MALADKGAGMSEVSIKEAFQHAIALQQEGRAGEALDIFEQILKIIPNDPGTLFFAGVARHQTGNIIGAVALLEQAAEINPDNPDGWNYLGAVYFELDRPVEAESAYRKGIGLNPSHADAWNNLGNLLNTQSRFEEAEDAFRHSLAINPDHLKAKRGLALILTFLKRYQEAKTVLSDLLAAAPDNPEFISMMGTTLAALSEYGKAEDMLRQTILITPDQATPYNDLGNCLASLHRYGEAESTYRKALDLEPDNSAIHNNLGALLNTTGRVKEAIKTYRRSLELQNDNSAAFSNLIFSLMHAPETSGEDILAECRRWDARHQASAPQLPFSNTPDPERRLKIGYVSPDFRRHAVAYFLEPLLASHNHEHFDIYAYAELKHGDDMTERFQEYADHWCNTVGMDDKTLAAQISKDGIDILVDCGGYTLGSRLMAFNHKPAPVQVATLLGHGLTTGLAAMDYILVDHIIAPDGAERFMSEELVRLPHGLVSFRPDPAWPEPTQRELNDDEEIVFAYFNAPARINSLMMDIWQQILQALPKARLLLKNHAYNESSEIGYWQEFFSKLPGNRIDFEGLAGGWSKNMDVYERVDIVLDSFPVTGSTSTAIPLWMGVPVITLAGDHVGQRMGAAFLYAAGLPELAAESPETYVEKVIGLARDKPRLALLRSSLRAKMAASPLCDHKAVTRSVENAYREMWKKWCTKRGVTG